MHCFKRKKWNKNELSIMKTWYIVWLKSDHYFKKYILWTTEQKKNNVSEINVLSCMFDIYRYEERKLQLSLIVPSTPKKCYHNILNSEFLSTNTNILRQSIIFLKIIVGNIAIGIRILFVQRHLLLNLSRLLIPN